MAPTHTSASASALPSSSPLTSANDNHGLLRAARRRQLLHPTIPPILQVARTSPLRRLWCRRNPLGSSIQIMWRMHDHPVLCTSRSPALSTIRLLIPIQSPDCQKRHWASHKSICQHTASQMSSAKQQPAGGQYDENVVKHLRKFTSAHEELLNWVVFQALQLKRVPANVRQQALIVELDYHPNAPDSLHRYANPVSLTEISQFAYTIYSWFSFTIKGTHVVPRTYVTGADANVAADIQRRDDRCRRNGGIGAAVVSIQCGGLSQVMPVEVDPPSQITWDSRDDWSEVARHFVNSGRTDFKPISTSSRGLVSLPFVFAWSIVTNSASRVIYG
jgi:hypothetical protein